MRNIGSEEIAQAVAAGIISREQGDRLLDLWQKEDDVTPDFCIAHVSYYLGALVVISAMGWFLNSAWEKFGGTGIFVMAVCYGILFLLLGRNLWKKQGFKIPAGLLVLLAVCMTPLAIYGMEKLWAYWPSGYPVKYPDFYHVLNGGWFLLEIGTIVSACGALLFFEFPFLTAPLIISCYFLFIDIVPWLLGKEYYWHDLRWLSLFFGLGIIILSFFVDYIVRMKQRTADYAFWGYLFGATTFWIGFSLLDEWSKVLYCVINVLLMLFGILVQRKAFLLYGVLGVNIYIGSLAYDDSLLFPVVLSMIGLLTIYSGIMYSKKQDKINRIIREKISGSVLKFFPKL